MLLKKSVNQGKQPIALLIIKKNRLQRKNKFKIIIKKLVRRLKTTINKIRIIINTKYRSKIKRKTRVKITKKKQMERKIKKKERMLRKIKRMTNKII